MKNYFRKMRTVLSFVLMILFFHGISCDSLSCYLPDVAGRYREHNVDFTKLILEVSFSPKHGEVFGKAKYSFKPIQPIIDSLFLDAPGIKTDSVKLNGIYQKFSGSDKGLTIYFNEKISWNKNYQLEISYSAQPRKGLYFIGWNDPKNLSRKQIWTQGQGIDNRHWFPCYDDVNDRLVTETIIAFDTNYIVVSNGKLLSKKKNNKGEFVWHYAMIKPHVPYLVMLAIDKYAYRDVPAKNGIVSRQYYYADKPETFEPTYQYSKEMMEWLPEELGVPYAWEVYANVPVQDFMYGAMENTSATIYTDFYLQDKRQALERNYIATNAHELTHQWFGDLVTEWSGAHHWLHESFATYYAKLFMRKTFGEENYQWNRRNEFEQAKNADERDRFPVAHSAAGSARHYPKGSAVIGMLRHVVGDSIYRKAVKNYLEKHSFGNVDTHDFWRAFMECCGMNLDWFFDEWILHSGYPIFEITTDTTQPNKWQYMVKQTQPKNESGKLFTMPAEIKIYFTDGSFASQKKVLTGNDTFSFASPANKKIAFTLFDEGDNILKKTLFEKPFEQLKNQAMSAKHFIDKYDAIVDMRKIESEEKNNFLLSLFDKQNYYPIQQEIIYQLRKQKNEPTYTLLKKAIGDKDLQVRRAAIDYIDSIPEILLQDYEKLLRDSSYITIETTLRKLCKQFPNQRAKFLDATKNVQGISRNVEITWLEMKAADELESNGNKLIQFTSNSYEFRTRNKAMEAIENLNYFNDELVSNLMDAATNANSRLANPAANTIRYFMKQDKFKEIYKAKLALNNYPEWAAKILSEIK
jgi:aminopeptidase N